MVLLLQGIFVSTAHAIGVGGSGMYQWSVDLRGYISSETGKAPVAYLWVPEGCKQVKAVLLSQQNMTEEAIYKNPKFQAQMKELGVAMVWVAPAFTNNWDPATGAQNTFEEMMGNLADQSGHAEIAKAPVSSFGTFCPGYLSLELCGLESEPHALHHLLPWRCSSHQSLWLWQGQRGVGTSSQH